METLKTTWKKPKIKEGLVPLRKKKQHNPKNIPLFENLYENPAVDIIEGFTQPQKTESNEQLACEAQLELEVAIESAEKDDTNGFKGVEGGLSKLNDSHPAIGGFLYVFYSIFKRTFDQIANIDQSIGQFILNFQESVNKISTKIANSLTQNTATESEIVIFKDQILKFVTIFLTWLFVYNWYYVIFYLKEADNVRYTFKFDSMDPNRTPGTNIGLLYILFGPSLRILEWLNYLIVILPACIAREWKMSNNVIFILMCLIVVFLVLVKFQTTIMYNFVGSFNYSRYFQEHFFENMTKIDPLFISTYLFVFGFVFIYAWQIFFGVNTGKVNTFCRDLMSSGSTLVFMFGALVFFLSFLAYFAYAFFVNVPIGITFFYGFIVLYSFFAIPFYSGTSSLDTIQHMSHVIFQFSLATHDEDDDTTFQLSKIPTYIYRFFKNTANWTMNFIFEILAILILVSGLCIYLANYRSTSLEKSMSIGNISAPVHAAFKNLFTWLILINVLLIILFVMYIRHKYNCVKELIRLEQETLPDVGSKYQIPQNKATPAPPIETKSSGLAKLPLPVPAPMPSGISVDKKHIPTIPNIEKMSSLAAASLLTHGPTIVKELPKQNNIENKERV